MGKGVCVLIGVCEGDTESDAKLLADKLVDLRIFYDADGKMNLSLKDVGGEALLISQFTLYADCRKGRRPSFIKAAKPDAAADLYERFIDAVSAHGIHTETGVFGADMLVEIENDGPVTIILDSAELKRTA